MPHICVRVCALLLSLCTQAHSNVCHAQHFPFLGGYCALNAGHAAAWLRICCAAKRSAHTRPHGAFSYRTPVHACMLPWQLPLAGAVLEPCMRSMQDVASAPMQGGLLPTADQCLTTSLQARLAKSGWPQPSLLLLAAVRVQAGMRTLIFCLTALSVPAAAHRHGLLHHTLRPVSAATKMPSHHQRAPRQHWHRHRQRNSATRPYNTPLQVFAENASLRMHACMHATIATSASCNEYAYQVCLRRQHSTASASGAGRAPGSAAQ